MAEHTIDASFRQPIQVVNKDLEIIVRRNGVRFGTLIISKGSIDWRPAKKWKGGHNEIPLSWTQFDRAMEGAKAKK